MMNLVYKNLFEFLRRAASVEADVNHAPMKLSAEEWRKIYEEAKRQSVLDVVFNVVGKLPKEELPPKPLLMCWAAHAEATMDMNKRVNKEAARLTEIFRNEGRRTAVLKGAANARLYPDPFSRQCGDIDLWIEGGRKSVEKPAFQGSARRLGVRPAAAGREHGKAPERESRHLSFPAHRRRPVRADHRL